MPRKPKITLKQIKAIAKNLALKIPVSEIAKKLKVSRTTVERVRAEYNAVFYQTGNKRLSPADYLTEDEYKMAERRAQIVDKMVWKALVHGVAASIKPEDILD